jgi:hypothetical protein
MASAGHRLNDIIFWMVTALSCCLQATGTCFEAASLFGQFRPSADLELLGRLCWDFRLALGMGPRSVNTMSALDDAREQPRGASFDIWDGFLT